MPYAIRFEVAGATMRALSVSVCRKDCPQSPPPHLGFYPVGLLSVSLPPSLSVVPEILSSSALGPRCHLPTSPQYSHLGLFITRPSQLDNLKLTCYQNMSSTLIDKSSGQHGRSNSDPLLDALRAQQANESQDERTERLRREAEARKISDAIDEQLRVEEKARAKKRTEVKILLLGSLAIPL